MSGGFDNLPPWIANRWFFLPTLTTAGVSGQTVEIAAANPNRVGLIISTAQIGGGGTGFIGPSASVGNGVGIQLAASNPYIQLTHHDWGVLTQAQWFGFVPNAGQSFSVVELVLRDWPQPDPGDNMDVRDYLAYIADFVKGLKSANAAAR